jgi:glycosyltransferase involved in cell wall biosynthesis
MIEAMACGTPVVSVDVSSAREMLELTGAGLVTPEANWPAMAAAIRSLVSNPALGHAMGMAGRQAAEVRFSVAQVGDQWRRLYASMAAGTPMETTSDEPATL